jgi:hypothetical protein
MSISQEVVHDTLLLGSFPAESTEAAFLQLSGALGDYASRVPDGEIGARRMWIGWQEHVLKDHRQFEAAQEDGSRRAEHRKMPDGTAIPPRYRLREGISAEEVVFAELGYVEVARESYEIFSKLKKAGKIPAKTRYQVSLPTSVAFLEHLVVTESQQITELAYEKRLFTEVNEIAAAVPPDELAIQWDVSKEMAVWERVWPIYFEDIEAGIIERLVRHGDAVPEPVELGIHLCYGDFGQKHWKEPDDTANMVAVANGVFAGVQRPIDWLHMPVPQGRDDDAYFAPLANLNLRPETRLYLGLVHQTDGEEGTRRRMATAGKFVSDFGIGTECGMGRHPVETIPELLHIHAAVAYS